MNYIIEPYNPYVKPKKKHPVELAEEQELFARIIAEQQRQNEINNAIQQTSVPSVGANNHYNIIQAQTNVVIEELLSLPAGFNWPNTAPTPVIYRNSSTGVYTTTLSADTYAQTGSTVNMYVDSISGSDTNSGTASSAPVQSWRTMVIKTPSLTGKTLTVHVFPGTYNVTQSFSKTIPTDIKCESGSAILASHGIWGTYFELYSGSAYKSTSSYVASGVVDFSYTGTYGEPQNLLTASGADDAEKTLYVINNPGYYHNNASDGLLYVRTFDDRAPDDELVAYSSSILTVVSARSNLYMKNIKLVGGSAGTIGATAFTGTTPYVVALKNVQTAGGTRYALNIEMDYSFLIMESCSFYWHNKNDALNYHDDSTAVSSSVIEIGCKLYGNCSGSSDQDSTAHDGFKIIRINGEYYSNTIGHNVRDVSANTQAWMLGCRVNNGNYGYYCGDNTGTTWWLDGCSVGTHDVKPYVVHGANDKLYYRNMTISPSEVTNNGTLSTY